MTAKIPGLDPKLRKLLNPAGDPVVGKLFGRDVLNCGGGLNPPATDVTDKEKEVTDGLQEEA